MKHNNVVTSVGNSTTGIPRIIFTVNADNETLTVILWADHTQSKTVVLDKWVTDRLRELLT